MIDFFLQIGFSNACFSLAVAIVAMAVGVTTKRPHLSHLLWLLVFVKLVTPPMVTIPIITIPAPPDAFITDQSLVSAQNLKPAMNASSSVITWSTILDHGKTLLPAIWLMGCVFVLFGSLVRVYRFHRLLMTQSKVGNTELQSDAAQIAPQLGLRTVPTIYSVSAHLSPMVWWIGGKVRIFLPTAVLDQMNAQERRWILAHELAHVRRRDYDQRQIKFPPEDR